MGLVVVFSNLSEGMQAQLKARGIPFAVVDPTGEPVHEMASVGATNWNGGLAATRHLLSLGHRRIGMITGPSEILCSRARLDGYRSAMDAAGVPVDPYLIRFGDFHVDSGVKFAREMLRNADPPTAIFAGNDLMALGRVPGGARGAAPHPGRPVGGGLRRPAGRALGGPDAHDGPPAAQGDGADRHGARDPDGRGRGAAADAAGARDGAGRPGEHGGAAKVGARVAASV